MSKNGLGIYIHVPFCRSKCPYCDFYSVIPTKNGGETQKNAFTSSICSEIDTFFVQNPGKRSDMYDNNNKNTIFIGGGTPNTLSFVQICTIISRIVRNISDNSQKNAQKLVDLYENIPAKQYFSEITLECNPFLYEKAEKIEFCTKIREAGVNRLSIGAQSFDNDVLKSIGRLHKAEDVINTVEAAREAGFENISIDLIFGIPGQSMDAWIDTVKKAVALPITHISLYSLEFMDGTRFTKLLDEGKMQETAPEIDREMYHRAIDILKSAGFEQYEISNFAKQGYCSQHNMKYWNMDEYVGFGPSAHSLLIGDDGIARRYSNVADLDEYIANPLEHECYEELTMMDQMSEFAFTALRMNRGIDLGEFKERFGKDFFEAFPNAAKELEEFVETECVELTDNNLKLTVKGFDISNKIFELFV